MLRWKIAAARNVLRGPYRWSAFEALGLSGHGADLLRIDFPPAAAARPQWGHGAPPHPQITALLDQNAAAQIDLLHTCLDHAAECRTWPLREDPANPALPWHDNEFLPRFDAAALYGMLRHLRPERYVEIGSGMSTRVAWQARNAGGFPMEIVSIDPEPRLEISPLCDRVDRRRLEEVPTDDVLRLVTSRTVVFFDGSHRSFPGSDVTVFFLNLLPRLPAGAVVQIHDIYLPNDYPPQLLNRYWSEQYLLAAYLIGGAARISVLLAGAYLQGIPEVRSFATAALGVDEPSGCSFWLRTT